ncbi:MAG TPA: hypothetical protein VNM16_09585 [Bacillota bacterium]|nr:hypothetical protein [Bacillota bacterium]
MATVRGILLRVDAEGVSLATGGDVLALRTDGAQLPPSLRSGDEVAGWREGLRLREVRLARIRTDLGDVCTGLEAGRIQLDTGGRVWDLRAEAWPGAAGEDGARLRVCHDGFLALWAADSVGEVWIPPPPPAAAAAAVPMWRKLWPR